MNIILCGPSFTGKTSLGKDAAQKLGWNFMDTDDLLEKCFEEEKNIQLPCREIYKKFGEDTFRQYESKAVNALQGSEKCVIALGGGCLTNSAHVSILKELGLLIYIKTALDVLQVRMQAGTLPSYLANHPDPLRAYQMLVSERSTFYEQYADKIIDTNTLDRLQIISLICENHHHGE